MSFITSTIKNFSSKLYLIGFAKPWQFLKTDHCTRNFIIHRNSNCLCSINSSRYICSISKVSIIRPIFRGSQYHLSSLQCCIYWKINFNSNTCVRTIPIICYYIPPNRSDRSCYLLCSWWCLINNKGFCAFYPFSFISSFILYAGSKFNYVSISTSVCSYISCYQCHYFYLSC